LAVPRVGRLLVGGRGGVRGAGLRLVGQRDQRDLAGLHVVQFLLGLRLDELRIVPLGPLVGQAGDAFPLLALLLLEPGDLRLLGQVHPHRVRVGQQQPDQHHAQHGRPPGEPARLRCPGAGSRRPGVRPADTGGPAGSRRPSALRRPGDAARVGANSPPRLGPRGALPARRAGGAAGGTGPARRTAATGGATATRRWAGATGWHARNLPSESISGLTVPGERAPAGVPRRVAELFFDPQQLVYFATRSERAGAPVLIWPQPVATARSAMVVSSVSPERWLIMQRNAARCARSTASRVSVSEPIWFTFTSTALADDSAMPRAIRFGLVTNRSSPTIWMRLPSAVVSACQPAQSSSASGSSIDTFG